MSEGWWSGFLVVFLSGFLVVNTKLDLDSTLRLAHCRASCLFKIKMYNVTDSVCSATPLCKQCWDTCQSLQTDKANFRDCKNSSCNAGCREACRYFQVGPGVLRPLVMLTHHEETLTSSTSGQVQWPAPRPGTPPAVYVVLGRGTALRQTLDCRVHLPVGLLQEEVRVLQVDWRGQTTVLGPRLESSLTRLRTVLRTLGLSQPHNITLSKLLNSSRSWRLTRQSMERQESLVVARISWDSNQLIHSTSTAQQLMYLVTWELENGMLRGNLLTNYTTVNLSLRPETVYTIRVSVMNADTEGIQSEPLVLDTHNVFATSTVATSSLDISSSGELFYLSGETSHPAFPVDTGSIFPTVPNVDALMSLPKVDLMALGVATLTAFLMILVLASFWRCRYRLALPHSKFVVEDDETPTLYRVFSPAVRLVGERNLISPDIYTSTDNLLQQH